MRGRLTEEQRDQIARVAHDRYEAGESWREIALDLDLHPGTVQRLVTQCRPVTFRRWGQKPIADPAEVVRRRESGETLDEIARTLGCSRTAVRTALEGEQGPPATRYPRLGARRTPADTELAEFRRLLEACPQAPQARPGHLDLGGPEGLQVATACLALVEDGVPMATLSRALGHGPTWVHWLLGKHDLQPPERQSRSTSRRTRA
ncbi:helix-turn-helix domain-containing protein [Brachybacterium sp. MASK1Z-5]|uniref:Helix-turn-helix domain-containing protein n=1 Tax=Brachybacterium halotolerans TaxID=2795215 RepID=A0ABS1BBS2_9MICO|nr:helix-turn-helix domain-containing protein [Brachybacterium halotolerans]MBK0332063.1 helix-turn-helix domain-containing protein [Brachybacterium halotolerans]